jgi:GT2 family glycosyltransferase
MRRLPSAPFAMREIDLDDPIGPVELASGDGGAHLLVRYRGRPVDRIWLVRGPGRDRFEPSEIAPRLVEAIERAVALDLLHGRARPRADPLSLTVAVCTRNRSELLRRCLEALAARCGTSRGIDVLVVDNAPPDDSTRAVAQGFAGVRYIVESVPGLDFARNRALASTDRAWLALVDDDAVVDAGWLEALAGGIGASPSAGGFVGPVLPLTLETDAQLLFEWAGGFGKGFRWARHGAERWGSSRHPAGAGAFGTGASMVFSTDLLRRLGGFDEALDTGPPLPGGGDIDIFYRVLLSGRPLVYLPELLVHHEHRRDLAGLASQYYSWGLALMAVHRKSVRTDRAMRARNRRYLRWWLRTHAAELARALAGSGRRTPSMVLAELRGALVGYFGEYKRSQARVAGRKRAHGA